MSRNYATIWTAVWREEDWRQLSANAQRTYLLLFSQPDISAAGVLPLTIGRWASRASNTTAASIRADLAELEAAQFLVADYDHEELLVRTFIKWDKGYNNPKRKPVIRDAVADVVSPILRAALALEMKRLGMPVDEIADAAVADSQPDSHSASVSETNAAAPSTANRPSWDRPTSVVGYAQVNSLSDRHSDRASDGISASERVVVTKALEVVPQPTIHKPQPAAALPAPASPDATPTQRSKAITDAYHAVEPMSKWPAVNAIVLRAIKAGRWSDDEIHAALLRLAEDGRSVTVDTLRVELTGPPQNNHHSPQGGFNFAASMRRALAQEAAS